MGSEIPQVDSKKSSSSSSHNNNHSSTQGHTSNGNSCSPTLALTNGIAELEIFIEENDVQNGARRVLHAIRPSWQDENIQFKVSGYDVDGLDTHRRE